MQGSLRLVLILLISGLHYGCSPSDHKLSGTIEFLSEEIEQSLQGEIIVRVFQDREMKTILAETRIIKKYLESETYHFEIDSSQLIDKNLKWEPPFYVRARFTGDAPVKEDPTLLIGPFNKESFLVGPLNGGESNLQFILE